MDKQKPTKKSAATSSRNKTQKKAKAKPCGAVSNVSSKKSTTPNRKSTAPKTAPCPASPREIEKKDGPPTDRDKKKEEKKEKVTPVKKKQEVEKAEKKLDRTQEDDNKETESGLSLVVKEGNVPVKMDDGYEDFGPGANNQ